MFQENDTEKPLTYSLTPGYLWMTLLISSLIIQIYCWSVVYQYLFTNRLIISILSLGFSPLFENLGLIPKEPTFTTNILYFILILVMQCFSLYITKKLM